MTDVMKCYTHLFHESFELQLSIKSVLDSEIEFYNHMTGDDLGKVNGSRTWDANNLRGGS